MSPQTRRSFAASAVALAGLGVTDVIAQEATPRAEVLSAYIRDIWNGQDASTFPDLFSGERLDLQEVIEEHLEWREDLRAGPEPVRLTTILENEDTAIGYGTIGFANGAEHNMFIMIYLNDDGRIRWYKWMSEKSR